MENIGSSYRGSFEQKANLVMTVGLGLSVVLGVAVVVFSHRFGGASLQRSLARGVAVALTAEAVVLGGRYLLCKALRPKPAAEIIETAPKEPPVEPSPTEQWAANFKKTVIDINRLDGQTKKEWSGAGIIESKYTLSKNDKLDVEYLIKPMDDNQYLEEAMGKETYAFLNHRNRLFEKLGADFYSFLSDGQIFIPKTRLLVNGGAVIGLACKLQKEPPFIEFTQPDIFDDTPPQIDITELSSKAIVRMEDKTIKLPAYPRLMIISQWIGDWDVMNLQGENLGIIYVDEHYQLMNIDSEHAFEFDNSDRIKSKMIQRSKGSGLQLNYHEIKENQELRMELAKTVQDILNIDEATLRYLLLGDNSSRIIPLGDSPERMKQTLEIVIGKLMEGQQILANLYADDLEWLAGQSVAV